VTVPKAAAVVALMATVLVLLAYVGLYSATHGPSGRYFVTSVTAFTERNVGWGQLPLADRFALDGVLTAFERSDDRGCRLLVFLNHRVDGGVSDETRALTITLMREVIDAGADLLAGCGDTGITPLWNAVARLDIERVELLMRAGADPESPRGWLWSPQGYGTLAELLELRRQRAAGRPALLQRYDQIESLLWPGG
jgi:hypothetical protein